MWSPMQMLANGLPLSNCRFSNDSNLIERFRGVRPCPIFLDCEVFLTCKLFFEFFPFGVQ